MIEIITGKPGGGKSYKALCMILDELVFGSRVVVTNLSLDFGALNEWLQQHGPQAGRSVDAFARVQTVAGEDAREFWRFRAFYSVIKRGNADPIEAVQLAAKLEEGRDDCGVFYVLDEAHVLYDARNWAKTSGALTYYNSQHRKLRDHCIFVTQFLKLLEGRVKGFAERFYVCRNFTGVKSLWVVEMPGRMRQQVFYTEPGGSVEPDEEHWVALDKKKACLYDTMAGVGMSGTRKAESRRATGLRVPWWSVIAAIVVVGIGFWYVVDRLPKWAAGKVSAAGQAVSQRLAPVATPSGQRSKVAPDDVSRQGASKSVDATSAVTGRREANKEATATALPAPSKPVWGSGRLYRGSELIITLTDGRTLRNGDIALLTPDKVMDREGVVYWNLRPPPGIGAPGRRAEERGTVVRGR